MKKHFYFPLLALVFTMNGFAQTYSKSDFTETAPPAPYSKDWYLLNGSRAEIAVKLTDGKLQFTDAVYSSKGQYVIPQGTLLWQDNGEWGGGIYFKDNDTTRRVFYINGKRDTIKNDRFYKKPPIVGTPLNWLMRNLLPIDGGNIRTVFTYQNQLYYLEGLAHMGINNGAIYRLTIRGDTITTKKVIDFDNAPQAMAISGDTIYIAGFDSFYIIKSWQVTRVLDKTFWNSLYPTSIAVSKPNEVYIGLRSGYARVDPIKKEIIFYRYNK